MISKRIRKSIRENDPKMSIKLVIRGITTLSGFNLILYVNTERKNVKKFTTRIKNSPATRHTMKRLFKDGAGRSRRIFNP